MIKDSDNSKWISRNENDTKSHGTNDENIKILSGDMTFSHPDKIESNGSYSQTTKNFNNYSNSKYMEFSNFMKNNKLSIKKKFVPNVIIRDGEMKKDSGLNNYEDNKEISTNESKINLYFIFF